MRIISHRGFWLQASEKNTPAAFNRSFQLGYGTETDLRDRSGQIVISHDPAGEDAMTLRSYLDLVLAHDAPGLLQALNIKADGLANPLAEAMRGFKHPWFVFDMSIPDMVQHIKAGNPAYARMSEYEPFPQALANKVAGIWLDSFTGAWFTVGDIQTILSKGIGVCVVSPELHGRADHADLWNALKPLRNHPELTLCTDLPNDAASVLGVAGHRGVGVTASRDVDSPLMVRQSQASRGGSNK